LLLSTAYRNSSMTIADLLQTPVFPKIEVLISRICMAHYCQKASAQ